MTTQANIMDLALQKLESLVSQATSSAEDIVYATEALDKALQEWLESKPQGDELIAITARLQVMTEKTGAARGDVTTKIKAITQNIKAQKSYRGAGR